MIILAYIILIARVTSQASQAPGAAAREEFAGLEVRIRVRPVPRDIVQPAHARVRNLIEEDGRDVDAVRDVAVAADVGDGRSDLDGGRASGGGGSDDDLLPAEGGVVRVRGGAGVVIEELVRKGGDWVRVLVLLAARGQPHLARVVERQVSAGVGARGGDRAARGGGGGRRRARGGAGYLRNLAHRASLRKRITKRG